MRSERVSPRQAVVVSPVAAGDLGGEALAALTPEDRRSLLQAALLDVLGALVRVDGVTIAVIAPVAGDESALPPELPAGVEVITHESSARSPQSGGLLPAAFRALFDRRFDRVVGVAGDVVRLTPRVVATALSALGAADLVVGPSARGAGYLVGGRDRAALDVLPVPGGASPFGGAELVRMAEARGLVVRRVEPLSRLAELMDLTEVGATVARDPATSPRVGQWLLGRGG